MDHVILSSPWVCDPPLAMKMHHFRRSEAKDPRLERRGTQESRILRAYLPQDDTHTGEAIQPTRRGHRLKPLAQPVGNRRERAFALVTLAAVR